MHLIFRGIFITIVILLIALVGFLSFLASLKPQPQVTRKVEEISLETYRAPIGYEGEKIISDSIRKAQQEAQQATQAQEKPKESQKSEETPIVPSAPAASVEPSSLPEALIETETETENRAAIALDEVILSEDEEEDEDEYEGEKPAAREESLDPIGDIMSSAEALGES